MFDEICRQMTLAMCSKLPHPEQLCNKLKCDYVA